MGRAQCWTRGWAGLSVGRGDGQGSVSDEMMGRAVRNSLEIVIKQVRLEDGFERGDRIRVAECLRQIVPDRWASIRKRSFTKCFCVYTGVTKVRVSDADRNCLAGV